MKEIPVRTLTLLAALAAGAAGVAHAQSPPSEETINFFAQNCASCHTIGGGPLAGPDLKGMTERQSEEWLTEFILGPQRVIDSGDPYAQELLRAARGVVMPKIPGVDRALAAKLVDLVRGESALERSRFAGLAISDRPLTEADVLRGERLFVGAEAYASGAPACYSCHTVAGQALLGGGRLGPDLTAAYARQGGRRSLAAWLGAPPSAVMQPLYRRAPLDGEEILSLVAYLGSAAESGESEAASSSLRFLLAGFVGTALLLVLFDLLWRKRYRATRRPLTELRRRRAALGSHS